MGTSAVSGWFTPWREADGWPMLARYASPLCLPPSLHPVSWDSDPDEVLPQALSRLVDKQLWLARPQWSSMRGQIVRDPDTVLQKQGGSCLDVALMVCAMLLAQVEQGECDDLRPMLAVGTQPHGQRHAFVLVARRPVLKHAHKRLPARRLGDLAELVLAADPSVMLRDSKAVTAEDVPIALAAGALYLDPGRSPFSYLDVVDVMAAHSLHPPLPPAPDLPDAIYEVLPPVPGPRKLRGWQRKVRARPGVTVVVGPPGTGKSAVALAAAERAESGAGWFLDASTASTLQRSLARAEVRSDPRLTVASRGARPHLLAASALRRLRQLPQPWVVILDGADDDPHSYEAFLPEPDPKLGQSLIIVASSPAWLKWARRRRAHRVVVPRGAENLLAHRLGSPGADPDDAVAAALARVHPVLVARLTAVAWMPPNDVAEYTVGGGSALDDLDLEFLIDAGLVDESTGIVHRIVREYVRRSAEVDWVLLEAMLADNPEDIRAFSDRSYYRDLYVTLGGSDRAARMRTLLLAAIARDHDDLAESMASDVLEALGWVDGRRFEGSAPECSLVAACLEARSRVAARDKTPEGQALAVRFAEQGLAVAGDFRVRSRLRALNLVGQRGLAGDDLERLREVLGELEDVHAERRRELPPGDSDVDHALFNLPGARLQLAVLMPEPERSLMLERAMGEYEQVLELREQYLGDAEVEDIAACLHGIGWSKFLIAECAASLEGRALARQDRVLLLGEAATVVVRALRIRLGWADTSPRRAQESAMVLRRIAELEAALLGAG